MLRPVVRCPMCGEAIWTERARCEACGVALLFMAVPVAQASASGRDVGAGGAAPPEAPGDGATGSTPRPSLGLPLLGRQRALDKMQAHVMGALGSDKACAVVAHGPSGAGKSAFLSALAGSLAAASPATRIDVRLSPGAREPLAPLERLVARWIGDAAGATDRIDAGTPARRLSRRLHEVGPGLTLDEVRESEGRLAVLAGLPGPSSTAGQDEVLRRPTPYLDALARALRLDASRSPLLVVLDGLDRATDEGRFLLAGLVRRVADVPIAWLVGSRSLDAASIFTAAVPAAMAELEPLRTEDLATVIATCLGDTPSPDLVSLVARLSQGYPGRAADVVASLQQSGAIRHEDGISHVEAEEVGRRLGAETAEALAGVFWEGLTESDRTALQAAAVLGEVVWDEALLAIDRARRTAGPPEEGLEAKHLEDLEAVRARLAGLVRLGFVVRQEESEFEGTQEYVFALDNLRAFVSGTMAGEARARMHLAAARWLDVRASGRAGFLETIAAHFAAGGAPHLAARRYGDAAEEARRRTLCDRALSLFRRKIELLEPDDHPERLATLHEIGTVQVAMGRYDAAEESFRAMLRSAWALGAPGKVAAALSKLGRAGRVRGDYPRALRDLEEALRLFRLCGDTTGIAAALTDLGSLRYLRGEYAEARRCQREALSLRRELEDDRGAALVLLHLAMLDRADGLLDRAATKTQEALRLGEDKAAPEELAQAMNLLGVLACDRGELDSALGYLQEGLKLAAGTDRRMETYLLNNIGEVQLWLGRMDEAGEALSRAMDLAAEQEDLRALAEIHRNVARLSLWKNRAERAVSYADRALALAEQIGSAESKAEAALVVAEVRAAAGTPEGGEKPDALFARAVEILRGIGHKVELARALLSWGAVLQMENRSAEAHPLLSEALQLFTEQGSKTAERVKALL